MKTVVRLIFAFVCLCTFPRLVLAAPNLFEPLEDRQRRVQLEAAPSGEDAPIDSPTVTTEVVEPSEVMEPSAIEESVAEKLNVISLDEKIRRQVVQAELEQFGYNVFDAAPTTFVPVTDIPVPPDYRIGPGDTLVVQIYGKLNVEYNLVVTRDGRLLIPELGPMQVGGMRFDELQEMIRERFATQVIGAKAVTTLGKLRTIRVLVVGDVVSPGNYTVSGLSTLLNTLMNSGGIKRTGSLRSIQVKRGGMLVATLDLYDVLLYGDARNDISLQHGDVILVPPIGNTVGIAGEVSRPAIYELRDEKNVADVIKLAGGVLPTASQSDAHIERIQKNNRYTLIDLPLDRSVGRAQDIQAGDIIRVFPVPRTMDDVVLLSGHVLRPGGFQYHQGMRASDLLSSPRLLRPEVDSTIALLRREDAENRRVSVEYLDINAVLKRQRTAADLYLRPRDEIIVFDLKQSRARVLTTLVGTLRTQAEPGRFPPMVIKVKGNARFTGTFPLQAGARLLDMIKLAGGAKSGTDYRYGMVSRLHHTNGRLQFLAFSLDDAAAEPLSPENLLLFPEDTIYLFSEQMDRSKLIQADLDKLISQTPYGDATPILHVTGEVRHPGRYPLEPGMRLEGLLRAAGGLKEDAYGLSAELTRYELDAGEYRVAEHRVIDFQELQARDEGLILQPHDHLVLHRKPNWNKKASVMLAGEVQYPGEYPITKGDTLCEVVQRAGGLTSRAYPFGAVFVRERVRQQQQKALEHLRDKLDSLLVNQAVSHSRNDQQKVSVDVDKQQELSDTIYKLERNEMVGRMVIDLSSAMQCAAEGNIVLQDGDKLTIPERLDEVTVVGEVYAPTSHLYRKDLGSDDYIALSGGITALAKGEHVYVLQANGEVVSARGGDWIKSAGDVTVTPGATIYVPLSVDRLNRLEFAEAWSQILYHVGISIASLNVLGIF